MGSILFTPPLLPLQPVPLFADLSDHCYLQPLDSSTGGCSLSPPHQPLRFKLECNLKVTGAAKLNCLSERLSSDTGFELPLFDGRKFSCSEIEWKEPRQKKKAPMQTTVST